MPPNFNETGSMANSWQFNASSPSQLGQSQPSGFWPSLFGIQQTPNGFLSTVGTGIRNLAGQGIGLLPQFGGADSSFGGTLGTDPTFGGTMPSPIPTATMASLPPGLRNASGGLVPTSVGASGGGLSYSNFGNYLQGTYGGYGGGSALQRMQALRSDPISNRGLQSDSGYAAPWNFAAAMGANWNNRTPGAVYQI